MSDGIFNSIPECPNCKRLSLTPLINGQCSECSTQLEPMAEAVIADCELDSQEYLDGLRIVKSIKVK